MSLVSDAAFSWSSPITLEEDEIWQARAGQIFITTSATPGANDGLRLLENHAVGLTAGSQVMYRKEGTGIALIVREVI